MLGTNQLGQLVGLRFGEYLGRQIALGACHDDRDDEVEKRPFRPAIAPSQLPRAVDLRSWMTPVEDQGAIGSCTSNALAGAVEYLIHRERGTHVDVSRLFVYFNQRLWDDRVRDDTGASIASGIRVLSRVGIPTEASWPYQKDLFAVQPPEPVFAEARKLRVVDYWTLPIDADALRGCLAAGFPIVFGTRVTESFVNTPRTGLCGMPQGADDRRHGRHALLIAGYDDARRVFIVKNSWGADWGDAGYVYMPYDYVQNRQWTTQAAWAIRLTTREAFDPAEHAGPSLGSLPKAPPVGGGIGSQLVGTVANVGAQVAVGSITGSRLLAGLAGGLIAGVTPGVTRLLRGRDRGAYIDRDRSEEILSVLRGEGPPPIGLAPMPWDDGLDEEAARAAGVQIRDDRPKPSPLAAPPRAAMAPAPVAVPPPIAVPPIAAPVPIPAPTVAVGQPAAPPVDFVARLPSRIAACWREEGGRNGKLGTPVSEPARIVESSHTGSVVRFERGAIIAWDPQHDAALAPPFALSSEDAFYQRWVELGAGRSALGFPIGPAREGALWCTRGVLMNDHEGNARAVFGMPFVYWQSLDGPESDLGLPLADADVPEDPSAPQTARFERGTLGWSPVRGTYRE